MKSSLESGTDTAANRKQSKYGLAEMVKRVLWGLVWPFFRFSPRVFFGWRCFLLRLFGAKIGKQVHIYSTSHVYLPWNLVIGDWSAIGEHALVYNLGLVTIGEHVTISQRTHICAGTHDYTDLSLPLIKPPITIGDSVWICADAFVGPGVSIGEGSVVGACAVVLKDVASWVVVGGNPAVYLKKRILNTY